MAGAVFDDKFYSGWPTQGKIIPKLQEYTQKVATISMGARAWAEFWGDELEEEFDCAAHVQKIHRAEEFAEFMERGGMCLGYTDLLTCCYYLDFMHENSANVDRLHAALTSLCDWDGEFLEGEQTIEEFEWLFEVLMYAQESYLPSARDFPHHLHRDFCQRWKRRVNDEKFVGSPEDIDGMELASITATMNRAEFRNLLNTLSASVTPCIVQVVADGHIVSLVWNGDSWQTFDSNGRCLGLEVEDKIFNGLQYSQTGKMAALTITMCAPPNSGLDLFANGESSELQNFTNSLSDPLAIDAKGQNPVRYAFMYGDPERFASMVCAKKGWADDSTQARAMQRLIDKSREFDKSSEFTPLTAGLDPDSWLNRKAVGVGDWFRRNGVFKNGVFKDLSLSTIGVVRNFADILNGFCSLFAHVVSGGVASVLSLTSQRIMSHPILTEELNNLQADGLVRFPEYGPRFRCM